MSLASLQCLSLAGFLTLLLSTASRADSGNPVAVRWWGQAMVSIETHWNLRLVIDPFGANIGYPDPQVSGDLVLVSHEHGDHNNVELVGGRKFIVRGLGENGEVATIDHVLDRRPGQPNPSWKDTRLRIARSSQAIRITSIASWHDDTEGSQRGANAIFLIEVDGLRIVHCGDLGQPRLSAQQLAAMGAVDVLLIPVGGVYTVDGQQAANITRQVKPSVVVPIHFKTPNLVYDLQPVQGFLAALGDPCEVVRAGGNTLAVSAQAKGAEKTRVVVLDFIPQQLPEDLEGLLAAKEKVCRESQQVFAKLSATQMNFRPGDGTHTPRWNAEHMMGRELGFFSQIYAELEPAITHLELNPQQMPPDYVAAHPMWSGAEESRQMERVTAFTRRFSYLLAHHRLDEPAPGSQWTPRSLLEQMVRHYKQHTENVKKKFALPDWPSE